MNLESMKKLMSYIDDPETKETINRIENNLEKIDRIKDRRENPEEEKIRSKNILASLDESMKERVKEASRGVALVLTGGGAKASFQVGAWKAISDKKLLESVPGLTEGDNPGIGEITAIAGTSAGALNAAVFVGGNAALAEKLWSGVDEKKLVGENGFFGISSGNDRYLESLIRGSGVIPGIHRDGTLTIATAFDTDTGYPKDFVLNGMSENEKVRALLASSAYPIALKEQRIKGVTYIDGGVPVFGSNMPVAPLYYLGFRRFIVIHCQSRKEGRDYADLNIFSAKLKQEQYFGGAAFVHLYSRRDLGGILEGTINFKHDVIMRNIYLGYMDMLAIRKDLDALGSLPDSLEEVHLVDGESYGSYQKLLENL